MPEGFSIEELVQLAILFFVFVLPGLARALGNKNEDERAPTPRRAPSEPADEDPWERLLRGEPVEPVEPVELDTFELDEPEPVARRAESAPPIAPPIAPLPPTVQAAPAKVAPPPTPVRPARAREPVVADVSSLEGHELPSELAPLSDAPLAPELSTFAPSELGTGVGELDVELAARADSAPPPGTVRAPSRVASSFADTDWRRAIVLREVLGTPVGLRQDAGPDLPSLR